MGVITFLITPRKGKVEFIELGIILLLTAATNVIDIVQINLGGNPNIEGNIYNLLNLPLGVLLYRRFVNWKNKNFIAGLIIVSFEIFAIINLFASGFHELKSYTPAFASVVFIIMSITYFYILIQELPTESITKLPMFWINTGTLIYYSGTFILDLTAQYMVKVIGDELINTALLYNFLNLIFYSILLYGMLLIRSEYLKRSE
jgi:hypothetical protein